MIVVKECGNAHRVLDDLPPDVRAVLNLFDDDYKLHASHSFIDFVRGENFGEIGLFRTPLGTGYGPALRQFVIWVREGMPERDHD